MNFGDSIFSLDGKTALVTGAGGYLGEAISHCLADAGAHVLVNGRSEVRVLSLVNSICSKGLSAEAAIFDVTDKDAVSDYFNQRDGLPLHVLINNAYSGGAGSIETSDESAFRDSYDIAVVASHNLVRSALPSLRLAAEIDEASVINICSMYGVVSPDIRLYSSPEGANPPFYGAAKAALLQWTRYAACEFGKERIRFNAISPGPFPSDKVKNMSPDFVKRLSKKVPMGRVGLPAELKGPILFLATPASSFVNGANIPVDGGWTCW